MRGIHPEVHASGAVAEQVQGGVVEAEFAQARINLFPERAVAQQARHAFLVHFQARDLAVEADPEDLEAQPAPDLRAIFKTIKEIQNRVCDWI